MKRSALSILIALLPASALVGGMAHADGVAITPMPYAPDTSTIASMAGGTLADAGVPIDLAGLPFADLDAAIATVTAALAGLPLEDPALPTAPDVTTVVATVQDVLAGVGVPSDVPTDADGILARVEAAVAGAGLPVDVPVDVPALPAVPAVAGLLATVSDTVAGLPLDTLPAAPDLGGVLALAEDTIAGLGISLPGS